MEDNGNPLGLSQAELDESLWNLRRMAEAVECSLDVMQIFVGHNGFTAKVLLKRIEQYTMTTDQVLIALVGDEDAGKSTLVGVLTSVSATLDNGRGLARMQVLTVPVLRLINNVI